MIYLLDDNHENLRADRYGIDTEKLSEYSSFLVCLDKIEVPSKVGDTTKLEFLKDATCIMIHKTMQDYDPDKSKFIESRYNVELIIEEICNFGEKMPLVVFSNSLGNPEITVENKPRCIDGIKKDLFYSNLNSFLDHYAQKEEIDLLILVYGEKYKIKRVEDLKDNIIGSINKTANEKLIMGDLGDSLNNIKEFFALTSTLDQFYLDEFYEHLEDQEVPVGQFKEIIIRAFNEYVIYGKNDSHWI
jgi:hypothetical protein